MIRVFFFFFIFCFYYFTDTEVKFQSHLFQMYAEALHENERLKSRLQGSKQELVKIRAQLEKVTQVRLVFVFVYPGRFRTRRPDWP